MMGSTLIRFAVQTAAQAVQRRVAFAQSFAEAKTRRHSALFRSSALCPRRPVFFLCATSASRSPSPIEPSAAPARQAASIAGEPTTSEKELPEIDEDDLEEQFVRGSGPGGQKINKTACCVVLKHKPSGVTVRCQETRSQMKNRQLARKILQRKLDEIVRGEQSLAAQELSKARARKARRRRKAVKKHFKSRRDKAILDG